MVNDNAVRPCAQSAGTTQRVSAVSYDTKRLIATVAAHLNVAPASITGTARNKEIARARLIVMYLLHEDTWLTWCAIGHALGRDHSTVMHGHARITELLPQDRPLQLAIEAIRRDMRHAALMIAPPAARARNHTELLEYRYWHMQAMRRAYGSVS